MLVQSTALVPVNIALSASEADLLEHLLVLADPNLDPSDRVRGPLAEALKESRLRRPPYIQDPPKTSSDLSPVDDTLQWLAHAEGAVQVMVARAACDPLRDQPLADLLNDEEAEHADSASNDWFFTTLQWFYVNLAEETSASWAKPAVSGARSRLTSFVAESGQPLSDAEFTALKAAYRDLLAAFVCYTDSGVPEPADLSGTKAHMALQRIFELERSLVEARR